MRKQRGFIEGRALASALAAAVGGAFVAGFALGVVSAIGLPALWQLLKPLVHGWTA